MKFALGKAIIFGVAAAAASFAGCSSDHRSPGSNSAIRGENLGELGIQLQVGDKTVNQVSYHLTNTVPGTLTYPDGTIDVTDAGALTAVLGSVPAGTWTLTLTATATDGVTPCSGASAPFVVAANQTVQVGIELHCTKLRNKGSILIDGTTNECPDITSVVGDAPQGCAIPLHVLATDDGKPNTTLSYAWTGAPGLTGANPVLNCAAGGLVNLNVTVSDGDTVAGCDATFGVIVRCPSYCPLVAATCTDAIQNQGETDVDCGGANCGPCASGKHCVAATDCTAGLVCTAGVCAAPVICADQVNQCGGPCPPCAPTTANLIAAKGAACVACANLNCGANLDTSAAGLACESIAGNAAAGPAAGQSKKSLCISLLTCELNANCGGGVTGASACYCGGAGNGCFSSGGTGVCKSQEENGLETTTPGAIQGAFGTTTLGGGLANQLVQCLADNSCSTCFQ